MDGAKGGVNGGKTRLGGNAAQSGQLILSLTQKRRRCHRRLRSRRNLAPAQAGTQSSSATGSLVPVDSAGQFQAKAAASSVTRWLITCARSEACSDGIEPPARYWKAMCSISPAVTFTGWASGSVM